MHIDEAGRIIDEYSHWVRENMVPVQQGNGVMVITPMLDRNNDCMSVLIGDSPDGGYVVTDLGETIANLELSGVSLTTSKRIETLDQFVRGYGVTRSESGELFVRCGRSEIAQKMNMLMQAMASVDDMFVLSQDSVREFFTQDVGDWLLDHGAAVVDGPSFPGKSGMMYKFDYALGRTREHSLRLIKTVNKPTDSNVKNALFGWQDVEESRRDAVGFMFLNGANGKDGAVPESAIAACEAYGITPIQWGIDEDKHLHQFAA